jgi:hypothetical protein
MSGIDSARLKRENRVGTRILYRYDDEDYADGQIIRRALRAVLCAILQAVYDIGDKTLRKNPKTSCR